MELVLIILFAMLGSAIFVVLQQTAKISALTLAALILLLIVVVILATGEVPVVWDGRRA